MAWTEDEDKQKSDNEVASTLKPKENDKLDSQESVISALKEVLQTQTVERRRARRWKIFFRFLYLSIFMTIIGGLFYYDDLDEDHTSNAVAVIRMQGTIGASQEVDANDYVSLLDDVYADPATRAVMIEMNSPGGSPVHSGILHDAITAYRSKRPDIPVVVVVEDMAASGGYYIASAADQIIVDKASLVGSIGVVSGGFEASELMGKIGVKRRLFTAGENKAFLDPFSPMSDQAKQSWQSVLDETHQQFIDAVKEGRGNRLVNDPTIFSGMVFTGVQAIQLGLADHLGYSQQVLSTRFAELKPIYYQPYQEPWDKVAKRLGVELSSELRNQFLNLY
ncbi:peptidase S49 [Marinomonas piezotolerans]|uniref:Peptidase S49 n=1 Tax=Marinomonas piezotolerans TaxID=2213058 RepID=A0A370UDN7_9GAMM|nr:S49 family peptidase [Marinomonas piezotolerans]RDL45902.1 peptidase S49 [Marinomonas piezotolerans]